MKSNRSSIISLDKHNLLPPPCIYCTHSGLPHLQMLIKTDTGGGALFSQHIYSKAGLWQLSSIRPQLTVPVWGGGGSLYWTQCSFLNYIFFLLTPDNFSNKICIIFSSYPVTWTEPDWMKNHVGPAHTVCCNMQLCCGFEIILIRILFCPTHFYLLLLNNKVYFK